MTKDVTKQGSRKPKEKAARRPRGGGVYVDGKRVEGTEPAMNEAHLKRIAERAARKAAPIKEKDDG